MHYSIYPMEMIMDEWDGQELDNYQEVTLDNRRFIVKPLEDNQMEIVQMISSDPSDFLNGDYQPGTVIEMTPQLVG